MTRRAEQQRQQEEFDQRVAEESAQRVEAERGARAKAEAEAKAKATVLAETISVAIEFDTFRTASLGTRRLSNSLSKIVHITLPAIPTTMGGIV